MEEPYIPTVRDWIHDLPVKRYENNEVGECFCCCILCNRNFIGRKFDDNCQGCIDGYDAEDCVFFISMIIYSEEPVTVLDAELLKKWMSHREAQLFKDCITAQMNQHYFDAINVKAKSRDREDEAKFEVQANHYMDKAEEIRKFLELFEYFSSTKYQFHKIKTTT